VLTDIVKKLLNKTSEAGFKEQFELYQRRLKEEEERKQRILRKQKADEERREERKKLESLAKHKKNVAAMGDISKELQAYVRQHFDQQRILLNHEGEKGYCDAECKDNQHLLTYQKDVHNVYL